MHKKFILKHVDVTENFKKRVLPNYFFFLKLSKLNDLNKIKVIQFLAFKKFLSYYLISIYQFWVKHEVTGSFESL